MGTLLANKGRKASGHNLYIFGASVLAIAIATPAFAQDAAEAESEEIVVTGVRASLERAMDIKRESNGVVDAVSAEDIGKFPDTNLAESLQRIPGVSIDRRNGEGSKVTVRGFGPSFNLVTLNGRQLATSDIDSVGGDQNVDFSRATSRSFDFSNLSPEAVSRLEVYKTGRAEVPSGGIGAAINVVTMRPLDGNQDGLRGSIGAKGLYDLSNDGFDVQPEMSGVLSWSNPDDTFGVSVFGAYQKRKSAAASATSNSWNVVPYANRATVGIDALTVIENAPTDPNQLIAIPNDSRYHYSQSNRERINAMANMQFKPSDAITLTADALFARNRISEERTDQTNWFNRPFDRVVFDADSVVATAVRLDEGSRYAVKDLGFEQQYRATETQLRSFGLNGEFEITDNMTLKLDGNHSLSKSNPNSANGASSTLVGFGAPVVNGHTLDWTGPIPNQDWALNDAARGNGNGVLDIGDLGTQVQRTNASRQKHRINQLRADLGWEFDNGGSFDLGATYVDSKMTSARTQTQQTLGDWGITRVGDVQAIAGDLVEQFCMGCQFSRYNATDAEIAFRGNAVDLYNAFAPVYAARGNPINLTGNDFDTVQEKIWSGYAQLGWKGDLMSVPAGIVAGARYEITNVTSTSLIATPDRIEWDSDNDFTRVLGTAITPLTRKGRYENLLPFLDFQIEPAQDLIARVSYSRTLARADYGNLFASQSANGPDRPSALGGIARGNAGNPNLKPLLSDNFDVSLEWYYGRSSFISAGFFAKKVKNFVGTGQIEQSLFGLRDPSSGAAGSRSGAALAELDRLSITRSDVNLFTMTALIIQNGGSLPAASTAFTGAYFLADGVTINPAFQTFAEGVLGTTDVIANSADPLFNFFVQTPVNNRQGNIHGFEIQGQHFFGESGFGVSASYTKVNGDVNVDVGADPNVNIFALLGLSDTLNFTGIYEKNGLSARASYNWRGKYLSEVNRGGSRNPVFFEPFGTLDVNVSYDINDKVSVSAEAINLLSEPIRSYGRSKRQLFFAQELKPRVLVGVRYKF
jgi:TonB-dependent receptor